MRVDADHRIDDVHMYIYQQIMYALDKCSKQFSLSLVGGFEFRMGEVLIISVERKYTAVDIRGSYVLGYSDEK